MDSETAIMIAKDLPEIAKQRHDAAEAIYAALHIVARHDAILRRVLSQLPAILDHPTNPSVAQDAMTFVALNFGELVAEHHEIARKVMRAFTLAGETSAPALRIISQAFESAIERMCLLQDEIAELEDEGDDPHGLGWLDDPAHPTGRIT